MRRLSWLVIGLLALTIVPAPAASADTVARVDFQEYDDTTVVLPNGHIVAYDYFTRTITERLPSGVVVRSLSWPSDLYYGPTGPLQILENGNLFGAAGNRILEITWGGVIVWQWTTTDVWRAVRLADGSHLAQFNGVTKRMDRDGNVLWSGSPHSFAPSPNGFWLGWGSSVTEHRLSDSAMIRDFPVEGAYTVRSVSPSSDGGVVVVACCTPPVRIREYNPHGQVVWTAMAVPPYSAPGGFHRAGVVNASTLYYTADSDRAFYVVERSLPDLELETLDVAGSADLTCLGCVDVSLVVRNVGNAPTPWATNVSVAARDGLVTIPLSVLPVPAMLAPGNAVAHSLRWDPAGRTGAWTLSAHVDPDLLVVERSDGSNIREATAVLTPHTTVSFAGSEGTRGWFVSDVAIGTTVHSIRPTSTFCSLDEGPAMPCDPAREEGAHELRVWSVDDLGNAESPRSYALKIDKTPPVITTSIDGVEGNAGWYRSAATFGASVADGASGIDRSDCGVLASTLDAFQPLPDGVHSVLCEAVDLAGNAATVSRVVAVDTTPPTTILPSEPVYGPASPPVVLASDATSGVASTSWELADGASGEGLVVDLASTPSGTHVVWHGSADVAGNVEEPVTTAIRVDADAPVTELRGAEPGALATPAGLYRTDADHDGFADALELALGTDPGSADSTPDAPSAAVAASGSLEGTSTETATSSSACGEDHRLAPGFTPEARGAVALGCARDGVGASFVLLGTTVNGTVDAFDPIVANVTTSVVARSLTIDGEAWPLGEDGEFSWPTEGLRAGRHELAWSATDAVGNVASGSRAVYVLSATPAALQATLQTVPDSPAQASEDADEDGVPAEIVVWDPTGGDVRLALDTDDGDARSPLPAVLPLVAFERNMTHGGATAGIGLTLAWDEERGVLVERELVGPFPVLLVGVPDALPRLRDADDDGVPRVWLKLYDVTIHADGSVTQENERDVDTGIGDPEE